MSNSVTFPFLEGHLGAPERPPLSEIIFPGMDRAIESTMSLIFFFECGEKPKRPIRLVWASNSLGREPYQVKRSADVIQTRDKQNEDTREETELTYERPVIPTTCILMRPGKRKRS